MGLDVGLGVPEEQGVGRHWLHWLIRVLSLLLLWCFGFLGDVNCCRPLFCSTAQLKREEKGSVRQIVWMDKYMEGQRDGGILVLSQKFIKNKIVV